MVEISIFDPEASKDSAPWSFPDTTFKCSELCLGFHEGWLFIDANILALVL
jgi:hypothetical protein